MNTVYDALDPIVNATISQKEKGTKYEAACVWYLANDPFWASFFSRVGSIEQALTWEECPVHDTQDTGIDLVAQEAGTGVWWAIQCKCIDSEKLLPKRDCDSFFARALGDQGIQRYMIMTTAKGLARNLKQQVENTGTMVVDTAKMDASKCDWSLFIEGRSVERKPDDAREHQLAAIQGIKDAFTEHDRCKAIMACGTGKTLMALRLAEEYLSGRGTVLFCAPSISLVGQSMRAWLAQSRVPLAPLVVCSDAKASRVEDAIPMTLDSFEYPATTRPDRLLAAWEASYREDGLTVVFSTYQSIDVIHKAQEMGLPDFDLIVCDEAHRTTGSALPRVSKSEASAFMKVHYDENVRSAKRLYMTATPRIYGETAKRKGAEEDYTIASMDDEAIYGPTAYELKFGEAVEQKLLTDYKVVVLAVEEDALRERTPGLMDDEGVDARALDADDIGKIIGCWKGLAEHGEDVPADALGLGDMLVVDDMNAEPDFEIQPLHRAVGFCSTIAASKTICEAFSQIVERYIEQGGDDFQLTCRLDHVDGSMNAADRNRRLAWLGGEVPENECRILTNVRCLAEGIDVPTLDAVIFFNAKNSTVDIVQAVGRVMRKADEKHYGYIILPIFVPSGMTPEDALDDSTVFGNVWSVLQALRSHDERVEARVNALALEQRARAHKGDPYAERHKGWDDSLGTARDRDELRAAEITQDVERHLSRLPKEIWEQSIRTAVVKKCGTRIYWDEWAEDVARIAKRHIERIGALVRDDEGVQGRFDEFLCGLRDSLNPGITEDDAVEMVAQHIITMPVFEALFGGFEFAKSNPVSVAIESFLSELDKHRIGEASDAEVLNDVYKSVRRRAAQVRTDTARQQLIRDLYEQFFKAAFEKTSQKMGVVYTPSEIIDYILRETDRVLRREFGRSLADEGVHILDPFAGTGSFMAHLIESDLIPDDKLEHKYKHELHSNEILLLAYYIMTVNIEYAYHARMVSASAATHKASSLPHESGGVAYRPFECAVLTDTFQMTEEGDTLDLGDFIENSERVLRQNELPITVIVGNPPYSAGQKSENDNNAKQSYTTLDSRIKETYLKKSQATGSMKVFDQYIRAFRWASDRIEEKGIICFVAGAGWLDSIAMDGFRASLVEEFNSIYVFNLRGNREFRRLTKEQLALEGDNVFGNKSKTPIAIVLLVKNPANRERGVIHYADIGEALSREEKLNTIARFSSGDEMEWSHIVPNRHNDWINQRDESWRTFAPIGLEKLSASQGIFSIYSLGVVTNRDTWAISFSAGTLKTNMLRYLAFYNQQRKAWLQDSDKSAVDDYFVKDARQISWTRSLKQQLKKGAEIEYCDSAIRKVQYRPFCKAFLYNDPRVNEMIYMTPKLFPNYEGAKNVAIMVPGKGNTGFNCLITNLIPDLNLLNAGTQCFPLYWYEECEQMGGLFGEGSGDYTRHDAITDEALSVFREVYPHAFVGRYKKDGGEELSKEDIFYYIYGILHSQEYRDRFAMNLKKELPRIPLAEDFAAFSRAGRALAELHLNYETVEPWAGIDEDGDSADPGRTEKMRFGKCKKTEENPRGVDRTVLHVSERMTLRNIPEEAYGYVVNGRSAIEWLMDRYQVCTDKASGIVKDPNDYSDDSRYIVELVERIVTVSMETIEIVNALPPLNEKPQPSNWPFAWKIDE